jgi:hypothetical protein
MVEFCGFLGPDPNDRLPLIVDLIGEFPGAIAIHVGNIGHQTLGNVLKSIEIII